MYAQVVSHKQALTVEYQGTNLFPTESGCMRAQVVSQEQVLTFEYQGTNFLLTVAGVLVAGAEGAGGGAARGMLASATAFVFQSAAGAPALQAARLIAHCLSL